MSNEIEKKLPILSLPDSVVFPGQTVVVDIVGKGAILAVQTGVGSFEQMIFLVAQKDSPESGADHEEIYTVGTVAKISQIMISYEDRLRIQVQGL